MVAIFRHWTDFVLHRVMPVSWAYLDLWERRSVCAMSWETVAHIHISHICCVKLNKLWNS